MKKKLLVLLIAVIPTLMPNLAFAIAIDVEDFNWTPYIAPPPAGTAMAVPIIEVWTDF